VGKGAGLTIDEIPGQRWEIALELLRDGGQLFLIPGDVPVGLQRYVGWPRADGQIHVSIFTETEPQAVTTEMATRDARAGLAAVTTAQLADSRLADLFTEFGVVYEYVYDYGQGAVKIGDVTDDGSVTLL
jgi:hypothetical protein